MNVGEQFKRAVRFLSANARWVVTGAGWTPPSVFRRRALVCQACKHWDWQRQLCKVCGCFMLKLWYPSESCPRRKWGHAMDIRRVLLTNYQAPGDIVVLTGVVRELLRNHTDLVIAVDTSANELWANNPLVDLIGRDYDRKEELIERGWQEIKAEYPSINQSNQRPKHFMEGWLHDLCRALELPPLEVAEFRGDIYLSDEEAGGPPGFLDPSLFQKPVWLLNAGWKRDYTAKQHPTEYFETIVGQTQDLVNWVQIGSTEHEHPRIAGTVDLRGKTSLRELVWLTAWSSGVLTPVSLPLHLAAAVPWIGHPAAYRPCIVLAGGREPQRWELYPGQQYLHTIGALDCCAGHACWRSRTVPLGDGDEKDKSICQHNDQGWPLCQLLIPPQITTYYVRLYAERQKPLIPKS